jgi:hypothetical protein
MPTNRGRNKCAAERLLEQVLITHGLSSAEIQSWFDDLYETCGATRPRSFSPTTHSLNSKAPGNASSPGGVDPQVKEYLAERVEWSTNPLPLGKGGH